jgi:hypothetical protein
MMIDDTLRVAGRARSVIERDRVPFVRRRAFGKAGFGRGEKGLVIGGAGASAARPRRVANVDDERFAFGPGQRRRDEGGKFGVGDQHLGFAVIEDERDRFRIEADVEGVQHRTRHRHAEMRLERFRDVRRQHRHRIAASDAVRRERRS